LQLTLRHVVKGNRICLDLRIPKQNDANVGSGIEAMTSKPELVSFLGTTRSPSDDRRTRAASQPQHSFREKKHRDQDHGDRDRSDQMPAHRSGRW
jgi:hypothetical protein